MEDLFHAADLINEFFMAKMMAYSDAFGGEFHSAPVKGEDRALQKVFRSYKEDFHKLCDLNRCSIVFDSLKPISGVLLALSRDPDMVLVRMKKNKMRFATDYDASLSAGYRDTQISICIDTPWTSRLGINRMILEVQLHDRAMYKQKTSGGHEG